MKINITQSDVQANKILQTRRYTVSFKGTKYILRKNAAVNFKLPVFNAIVAQFQGNVSHRNQT
jgi:hypothetical protein